MLSCALTSTILFYSFPLFLLTPSRAPRFLFLISELGPINSLATVGFSLSLNSDCNIGSLGFSLKILSSHSPIVQWKTKQLLETHGRGNQYPNNHLDILILCVWNTSYEAYFICSRCMARDSASHSYCYTKFHLFTSYYCAAASSPTHPENHTSLTPSSSPRVLHFPRHQEIQTSTSPTQFIVCFAL